MYNLIKLLTEEPHKLEKVGFLFLKLLVTLFIGSAFFGYDITLYDFVDHPIPKDYSITKFIVFLIMLIIIWFVVWSLIAEVLLTDLIIYLCSKIGDSEDIFTDILHLFNVVVKKGKNNLKPNKNVIAFNAMLQSYNQEDEDVINEGKSRVRQYYTLTVMIFMTLLFASDIKMVWWLHLIVGFVILNMLFANVIISKIHFYFTDNLDLLKRQFGVLSFHQVVINSAERNSWINANYCKEILAHKIVLTRKTLDDSQPSQIKLIPIYSVNEVITEAEVERKLKNDVKLTAKVPSIADCRYNVLVSNVRPSEKSIDMIRSLEGFAYLYCENEEQVYKNLEILTYVINNKK